MKNKKKLQTTTLRTKSSALYLVFPLLNLFVISALYVYTKMFAYEELGSMFYFGVVGIWIILHILCHALTAYLLLFLLSFATAKKKLLELAVIYSIVLAVLSVIVGIVLVSLGIEHPFLSGVLL